MKKHLLVLALVVANLSVVTSVAAYTKTPSSDPANEPIDFVVSQTDFEGGSCQNGYYGALQIRFDGQTVGYGSITDWVQSNGSSDITFSDVTLDAGWALEYSPHPSVTTDVLSVYAICNASAAIDYGWSANNLSDTFEWSVASTPASTSTTEISDTELGAYAILTFLLSALVAYVLIH